MTSKSSFIESFVQSQRCRHRCLTVAQRHIESLLPATNKLLPQAAIPRMLVLQAEPISSSE
ncbi:hypothetical protein ACJ73_01080 [Blastomyces percursus]|uniref:Uncharacterized protein n=1 Tax=Blastomyces percursus TaxID=1658174 RepID=A0A1J9QFA9_9EURO|nr:hypothetical protein ACJ73_01080 [Blastomyces percursus]